MPNKFKGKLNPLVSIIMNCYNGEKYLKESLSSLLSQSYKNWELIFWDNCSKDQSKKIFLQFKDKRFKYFKNKEFKNLYDSRNLAIKKVKGKFVCFLDTDDFWKKEKLSKQIKLFTKDKNLKFVYSNFFQFNQDTKISKIFKNYTLPEGKISQQIINDYCIGVVTVMIESKVLKKNFFNKKFNIIGDFDLFFKLSKKLDIKCLQEPLAYYRIHHENYSKLRLIEYLDEINIWLKKNSNTGYSLSGVRKLKYKLLIKIFLKKIFDFF